MSPKGIVAFCLVSTLALACQGPTARPAPKPDTSQGTTAAPKQEPQALPPVEYKTVFVCTKPKGWVELPMSLEAKTEGTVCGEWRHPEFTSFIAVKYFSAMSADDLPAFAVKTVQRQKAQGYAIDSFTHDDVSAQIKLSLKANANAPAQSGLIDLLATRDGKVMLVMGVWDAAQADRGVAAYIEALTGVDLKDGAQ